MAGRMTATEQIMELSGYVLASVIIVVPSFLIGLSIGYLWGRRDRVKNPTTKPGGLIIHMAEIQEFTVHPDSLNSVQVFEGDVDGNPVGDALNGLDLQIESGNGTVEDNDTTDDASAFRASSNVGDVTVVTATLEIDGKEFEGKANVTVVEADAEATGLVFKMTPVE